MPTNLRENEYRAYEAAMWEGWPALLPQAPQCDDSPQCVGDQRALSANKTELIVLID